MGEYNGVYQAFCVDSSRTPAHVTVPQVFGTSTVPLYSIAGLQPVANEFGWVSFVSGEAAYPIWLGPAKAVDVNNVPGAPGPPGPPGPPGLPGNVQVTRIETPATVWTINHNLTRPVAVAVTNLAGEDLLPDIVRTSLDQVRVTHETPQTGIVVIN